MNKDGLTREARKDLEKLVSDFEDALEASESPRVRALIDYVKSLAKME